MKNSKINILKITTTNSQKQKVEEYIPIEEQLHIILNNKEFVTLLATPVDIDLLAIGFLFTQGIIKSKADIQAMRTVENKVIIEVSEDNIIKSDKSIITSGCGQGVILQGLGIDDNISTQQYQTVRFTEWTITRLMKEFLTYSDISGVHFAALADNKSNILSFKEDIGRHNAIDKVIGECLIKSIDFNDKILLTTGRISSEMVLKAIHAQIPVIVARSCPTSMTIKLAEKANITVIGHVRTNSMNVYTHHSRIVSGRDKLVQQIQKLKKKKQAVILAHNYQRGEIQDIADFVGDSLDLSRKAAETNAKIIVFCGVHFMAEIAKILSPEKTVLLPDIDAGCPMADMVSVEDVLKFKQEYPEALVVSYVNTHAEVKAVSDYCCTSANGIKVINSLPSDKEIIFTPDKYLGGYIAQQTNRDIILMHGFCPTHQVITVEGIMEVKKRYPDAKIVVHPECNKEVVAIADAVLGTNGMCKYVRTSDAKRFIIGTEIGIIYRLKKENPDKEFYPASERAVCPNMKITTLEKVLWALEDERYKIDVAEDIARKAKVAIQRMLEIV